MDAGSTPARVILVFHASTGQAELFARSVEITALLNVYLELRGRSYRHGVPENAHLLYPVCLGRVQEWVAEHLRR